MSSIGARRIGDAVRFALTRPARDGATKRSAHRLVLEDPPPTKGRWPLPPELLRAWRGRRVALAAWSCAARGCAPCAGSWELQGIEGGNPGADRSRYPLELTPLTGALNAMIRHERSQLQRYRNALGDLAHSLKTPLAVLRGLSSDERLSGTAQRQLDEQVGRMQQIADHQLSRAATAGRRALAQPVAVQPIAAKLASALKKVYADKRSPSTGRIARLLARVDRATD